MTTAEHSRNEERENKALDALIAYSLRIRRDEEVTQEEMDAFHSASVILTKKQENDLVELGESLMAEARADEEAARQTTHEVESEAMVLARKKPKTGYSPKTEKELKRLRAERKKKKRKEGK